MVDIAMDRWTCAVSWGARAEPLDVVASRARGFLRELAELNLGLDHWFLPGEYEGRPVLWDARGRSSIIERGLSANATATNFGQGLPPLRSYGLRLHDGGSPRQAECFMQFIEYSPPIRMQIPSRVQVDYSAQPYDPALQRVAVTQILQALIQAFGPDNGLFGVAGEEGADTDDEIQGRPVVGRLTYLAEPYGSTQTLVGATSAAMIGGTLVSIQVEQFDATPLQSSMVEEVRKQLRERGLLLTRQEYDAQRVVRSRGPAS